MYMYRVVNLLQLIGYRKIKIEEEAEEKKNQRK